MVSTCGRRSTRATVAARRIVSKPLETRQDPFPPTPFLNRDAPTARDPALMPSNGGIIPTPSGSD